MTRILSNEDSRPVTRPIRPPLTRFSRVDTPIWSSDLLFTSSTRATISSRLAPASASLAASTTWNLRHWSVKPESMTVTSAPERLAPWREASHVPERVCMRWIATICSAPSLTSFSYVSANKPTGGWLVFGNSLLCFIISKKRPSSRRSLSE